MRITIIATQSIESSTMMGRIIPLFREMNSYGVECDIIALHHDYKNLSQKRLVRDGIPVNYVGQMAVLKNQDGSKKYETGIRLIITVLKSTVKILLSLLLTNSKILYVVKPHPQNVFPALLAGLLRRKKIIIDSDDLESSANKVQNKLQRKVLEFSEKIGIKFSTAIVTCSLFLCEYYEKLGVTKDKLYYIPTGLENISKYKILFDRKEFFIKNRLSSNTKILLYCGSLSISSGHRVDILLKSLKKLLNEITEACLIIAGSGEDRKYLEDLSEKLNIENHVLFYGRYQINEIRTLINIADVVVDPVDNSLTNKAKSSSRVLQALSLTKPVATSKVGIRKEILGDITLVAKPGDKDDLARVIEIILSDNNQAKEFENKQKLIGAYYWPQLASGLYNLIHGI